MSDPSPGPIPEAASLYRELADHLPGLYREDPESWAELSGYLEVVDHLFRAYLIELEDLPVWLSPSARSVGPPGVPPDQAAGTMYRQYDALFEELAAWSGWKIPGSWRTDSRERNLDRIEGFLSRAARVWRRRGTPRGFASWFCLYFRLYRSRERPYLIEHFKYRPPDAATAGANPDDEDEWALRVTLLVPVTSTFEEYARRREARQFLDRHLPAHLLGRLCWVPEGFSLDLDDEGAVRDVIRGLGSFVPHDDGIHLLSRPERGRVQDLLDSGHLPGGGTTTPPENDR